MAVFSIIQKSQLEGVKRLDAEYYQPEYLDLEKKFAVLETKTLGEISESVISFGAYSLTSYIEWQKSGVPYINVGDIHDGYIDFSGVKYISERVNEILKKSKVSDGQVLLSMAGTIGNAAVAHNLLQSANANQAIAKIALNDIVSPYYLVAFFNSKYGLLQTRREIVSSVQENIFLGPIKKFKIPIFTRGAMSKIINDYKEFLKELENSKSLYSQAENLLLEELKFDSKSENDELGFVVNLSEVKYNNRCDAEYFQPKYKKLLEHIKKSCGGVALGELVTIKKGIEPGAEEYLAPFDAEAVDGEKGKQFIRVSSLSKFGVNNNDQKYLNEELYQKLKDDFEPKKGEILLTKDASPGIAYVLKDDIEGIVAGGVLRLKLKNKETEDEYLALCINSIVGQMQAERDAGGSVIAHWKPEQIKNILIPILPKASQQKISNLIRQSHESRKKAKELLEEAKRKVEELIENN